MEQPAAFEQYLSSFPIGQLFRLVDPLQQYWNRDTMEFKKGKSNASLFPASQAQDEIRLALKYTYFQPMLIMLEPAKAKPALILPHK